MVAVKKVYSRTKFGIHTLTAFGAIFFGFIALFFISSFRLPTFLGGGVAQADYTTVASGGDSVASAASAASDSGGSDNGGSDNGGSGCDSGSGGSCSPD